MKPIALAMTIALITISSPPASGQDIEGIVNGIEKSPYFKRAEQAIKRNEKTLHRKVREKIEEKKISINAINEQIRNSLMQSETSKSGDADEPSDDQADTRYRIYIFVSRSIPIDVLRSFAADIDTLGSDNIRLAFRAFPKDFLYTFLQKDQHSTQGDSVVKAKVIIGEKIFKRYRVDRVPAVVFDPDPANSQDDWLLVYGAVSLHQALELFHRASGRQELKTAANRVAKIE